MGNAIASLWAGCTTTAPNVGEEPLDDTAVVGVVEQSPPSAKPPKLQPSVAGPASARVPAPAPTATPTTAPTPLAPPEQQTGDDDDPFVGLGMEPTVRPALKISTGAAIEDATARSARLRLDAGDITPAVAAESDAAWGGDAEAKI